MIASESLETSDQALSDETESASRMMKLMTSMGIPWEREEGVRSIAEGGEEMDGGREGAKVSSISVDLRRLPSLLLPPTESRFVRVFLDHDYV